MKWLFLFLFSLSYLLFPSSAHATPYVIYSWADESPMETYFAIERSDNGSSFTPLVNSPANSTYYFDFAITWNHRYCYRARACDGIGCGPYNQTACVAYPGANEVNVGVQP